MPLTTIEEFNIKRLQVIDEAGNADASVAPDISDALYKRFFESIILARTFNQRAVSLQREGRLGTYPSILGQEASQIGSALAFEDSDWVVSSFRETGVFIASGYQMALLLRYWMGDERGMRCPDGLNIYPMAVPVGSQIPHAVGIGIAMNYRGDKKAVAVYFGDGGSSRGDFHEGLNIAGVFKAPCVFLCQNNQWAISVPRSRQTAARSIAQRAASYGIEGIQVDGNDVAAVYKAASEAVAKAKAGNGPTLIECYTYRLDDHTTSDDATRYRTKDEVEQWQRREPLIRLRLFLEKKGLWTQAYEDDITNKALAQVDEAVGVAEAMPHPVTADTILYTNKELSPRQILELKEHGG
ncbi:MAG: pyruvate dehydrogenase (acetyl-transferring) E1 component subunit alpha [Deltaproteobacteria bacterium RIFCSPLOWO2_02_FULL_53_8]|nr:MAG: pyruvate dehydrogenase (acetyl-transferring) E1 component subunit alpha [Deltaproteobacteria bacterium RIFCSPLOWO2_02_FULL_53_8]